MSSETGLSKINHIIKSTLAVIEESRGAILDIADNSRKEVVLLKDEIKALQAEVQSVIRTCERLERMTLKSRIKLATISEDYDNYSEEEMRAAYEEADKLRVDLAVWRERERQTILRRNELERRLKNAEATLVKAEKLVAQVSTVLDYLAGDLSRLDEHIESTENKRVLALRIIKTQEEERRRIAREMHDGPAQSMTNVVLKAELCERLSEVDMDMAKKELSALKDMVRDCLKEIRRIIYDLRPMSIDDLGLKPTLQKYIENFTSETDIRVELMFIGSDDNIKDSNIALTVF
ncbi:MAG: histidine kinase [Bacillota bacterium]|nr:histidine kinase [Bacillota bacterium]